MLSLCINLTVSERAHIFGETNAFVQGVGVGRWEDVREGLGGGRENNRGRTGITVMFAMYVAVIHG